MGYRAAASTAILDVSGENEEGSLLEYLPKQEEHLFICFGPSYTFTYHKSV